MSEELELELVVLEAGGEGGGPFGACAGGFADGDPEGGMFMMVGLSNVRDATSYRSCGYK